MSSQGEEKRRQKKIRFFHFFLNHLGELDDVFDHQETVGTVSRICQELPRCNWLEEKILKTSTPAKEDG